MKKTNLRLKNKFIIEIEKEYYLSSIKDLKEWKSIDDDSLEDHKNENVTDLLHSLMKKHGVYSNVNFFDVEDEIKKVNVSQKGG